MRQNFRFLRIKKNYCTKAIVEDIEKEKGMNNESEIICDSHALVPVREVK